MQNIEMDKLQYKIYHENKIHTPDDFPYNTYLCSIPLDFQSVNLHWHDEVEIIVIKKGSGIVSVDLTTYSVSAGDIIFVLPGQLHAISQKDNEEYSIQIQPFKIIRLWLMQWQIHSATFFRQP